MPRWVVIVIVAPLALCVTCASLGYFVLLPRMRGAVAKEMANAVATSVSSSIVPGEFPTGRLVLTAADLNVNNEFVPGECGFQVTNDGTRIYGVVTQISPSGIALVCGVTYSAVPVVENGRVELTQVVVSRGAANFVLPKGKFAEGMENGINRALESNGLTPAAIALQHDSMTIMTNRVASQRPQLALIALTGDSSGGLER
ncbi:MAG: hypothetical protein QOF73_3113 [Thermomicrobiales bacterium]|nr:hypothetical protein [Thermomicrobiales bacterium]